MSVISDNNGKRMMVEIEDTPRVVLMTDKVRYEWDPEMPSLEELGYRSYEKDVLMRATYYARRPWVYLLRARIWVQQCLWGILALTRDKIWHSDQEGVGLRWRDVRLGPGTMCKARAAVSGMQVQIQNQYHEIGKLQMEKEAALYRGRGEGWDQHVKVAEKYIDDRIHSG